MGKPMHALLAKMTTRKGNFLRQKSGHCHNVQDSLRGSFEPKLLITDHADEHILGYINSECETRELELHLIMICVRGTRGPWGTCQGGDSCAIITLFDISQIGHAKCSHSK